MIALYALVEHLVQWFSSPHVIELQATTISLDIQNPIVEMKFKQVTSIIDLENFHQASALTDSADIGISPRNNEILDALFRNVIHHFTNDISL